MDKYNRPNRKMMMMSRVITSTKPCLLSILLLTAFTVFPLTASQEWNYDMMSSHGPRQWTESFPQCDVVNNPNQSPIRLEASESFYGFHMTKPVNFIKPTKSGKFTFKNEGHKLKLFLPDNHFVEGGSLPATCAPSSSSSSEAIRFKVEEIHVLFSANNAPGVEHALADMRESLPLEIQAYAFDHKKYKSLQEALGDKTGKSVMAVSMLHKLALARNYRIEPIVQHIDSVSRPGMEIKIPSFDLNEFLPKRLQDRDQFFTYTGSLPYPPCTAGVTWTVMAATSTVGEIQMKDFRKKVFEFAASSNLSEKVAGNARFVQRTLKRHVIRSSSLRNYGNGASSTSSFLPLFFLFTSISSIFSSFQHRLL